MASDSIPVVIPACDATRRAASARRRGAAITVPANAASTITVPAVTTPADGVIPAGTASPPIAKRPWMLPPSGLAVFYGRPETPRLFHYFLPRLLAEGKQVLCLDGGNRFDPLLIARLARQRRPDGTGRGGAVADFNRHIRVARAFTCFQLTELLVRVPRMLEKFAADALIVTALPDLYFDEDVREHDAHVAFRHALDALQALRPLPLGVAVFSDATSIASPRRTMFAQLTAQATELWRFALDGQDGSLRLIGEKLGEKAGHPAPSHKLRHQPGINSIKDK
jgi:hypothetical protein